MRAAIWREDRATEYAHRSCEEKNAAAKNRGHASRAPRAMEVAPPRWPAAPRSASTGPHRLAHPWFQHTPRRRERTGRRSQRLRGQEAKRGGKSPEPRIHGMGFARMRPGKPREILGSSRRRQNARRNVAPNSFRYRSRGERSEENT